MRDRASRRALWLLVAACTSAALLWGAAAVSLGSLQNQERDLAVAQVAASQAVSPQAEGDDPESVSSSAPEGTAGEARPEPSSTLSATAHAEPSSTPSPTEQLAPTSTSVQTTTPTSVPPTMTPIAVPATETPTSVPPVETPTPVPTESESTGGGGYTTETFQLCGGPDADLEREIEELIAGRNFSAKLTSGRDECAELTITVRDRQPGATITGSQRSKMTVSVGSGNGSTVRRVSIQIVTENGATDVSIGGDR